MWGQRGKHSIAVPMAATLQFHDEINDFRNGDIFIILKALCWSFLFNESGSYYCMIDMYTALMLLNILFFFLL